MVCLADRRFRHTPVARVCSPRDERVRATDARIVALRPSATKLPCCAAHVLPMLVPLEFFELASDLWEPLEADECDGRDVMTLWQDQ